ncbi:MAG TPA: hypothetical protein VKA65_04695 [Acidimicrobiales bacterium]|nr:hypothetical protein [Acidimicrobiales bacterium]
MERLGPWLARLTWLALPLVAGPALGDALDGASRPVQLVASIGLWVGWAGVLVATLVPATVTLTVLRIAAPAAVAAAVAATIAGGPSGADVAALVGTLLAALATVAPFTVEAFVDGSSYGEERRLPLRVPGVLALGPIPVVWALVVAGIVTGPLLLAARQWVAGAVALVVGALAAWWGVRVLHTLARRWVVFVPAGLVVHDPLALVEPVLLRRGVVTALGPAPADTRALDLTRGALGLALEVRLAEPVPLLVLRGRGRSETVTTGAMLITPSRPGALLTEARDRRLA